MAAFRPLTCNFLGRQLAPKPLSLLTSSLSSGSAADDHQRRRLQHTSAVEEQQQQQSQPQVIRDMMAPRIVRCPFPDIELPSIPYAEFVLQGSESLASTTAVQCGMTGRSYSYGVLNMAVRRLGAALAKRGFVKGDVLALISPNIPEFAVAFLATTAIGGVVTTVNPIYTTEEIARQLVDCNAKFVLTVPFCSETVVNAAAKSPSVQEVFSVGDAPGCTPAMSMLADADEKYFPHNLKIDPYDDLVCLPYSSGTTGPPKGVMITHFNLCANITQMCHPEFVGNIGGDDIMLAVLPFFHIYGLTGVMSVGLHTKSKIVTLPKFDPEMYINALREHRPTILHVVPPMLSFFAKTPLIRQSDFDSVKSIFVGAAPLSTSMCHAFLERIHPHTLSFQEGFGMTETSPVTHMNPVSHTEIGTCGVLVPNTEAKIVDVETREMLGPMQPGELLVRGPQIMKGYFNKPEATADTIDAEGWLNTGDIAMYDEEEYFKVIDRLKELIKVKGMQVSPAELEDLLMSHPGIQDAAVIGIPDHRAGELPRAYIVRKDQSLSASTISTFVESQVAPHKALKGGVEFVDAIPKTQTGKILHRALKQQFLVEKERS